jgi:D-alanine-D-alanine ligase
MKKLRISVLMHEKFLPPDSIEGLGEKDIAPFKTEYDVTAGLRALGHEVVPIGIADDLAPLRTNVRGFKPDVVFNLLEEFAGVDTHVPFVLGYLELAGQRYTGCNPWGMMLACNKGLTKKILRYHRIRAPEFVVVPLGSKLRPPPRFPYPMIVKSATSHGSVGIAQASFVTDEQKLTERVTFIHEQLMTDAIVEQYIEGRELYVGVMGNHRLATLPTWEFVFENLPDAAPRIVTERMKWSHHYQERTGITTKAAGDLSPAAAKAISNVCKRIYRALGQTGYARMDLRYTSDGHIYLLESNPNPQLARGEDFAASAESEGVSYEKLLQRIVGLGLTSKQAGGAAPAA